jgi:hypothetical protein
MKERTIFVFESISNHLEGRYSRPMLLEALFPLYVKDTRDRENKE